MSAVLWFVGFAYRTLTGLYPSGYRREYTDELNLVFDQALQDAARQGFPAVLRFFGRELRDLPGALARQNILERNLPTAYQSLPDSILNDALQKKRGKYALILILASLSIFLLFFSFIGGRHMEFIGILIIVGGWFALPIGIALLVVWITGRKEQEQTPRHKLLVLLGITVLVLALLNLVLWLNPYGRKISSSMLGLGLLPVLVALLVLLFINAREIARLWKTDRLILLALGSAILILFGLLWLTEHTAFYIVIVISAALTLAWYVGTRLRLGWLALLSLLSVGCLVFLSGGAFYIPRLDNPAWLSTAQIVISASAIILVTFLPAALLYTHLKGTGALEWRRFAWVLVLVLILVAGGGYQVFWDGVWSAAQARAFEDHLPFTLFFVSLMAGVLLAISLRGRRRLAGAAYVALVIVTGFLALSWGWKVSAFKLTEGRAARVNLAIAEYYQDNQLYPADLNQLTPHYLLYLPPPVVVRRGSWCYQGGADFYRLGYVSGKFTYSKANFLAETFAQAGELPPGSWNCDQQVEQFKAGNLSY
jgi:hypothetical protein